MYGECASAWGVCECMWGVCECMWGVCECMGSARVHGECVRQECVSAWGVCESLKRNRKYKHASLTKAKSLPTCANTI